MTPDKVDQKLHKEQGLGNSWSAILQTVIQRWTSVRAMGATSMKLVTFTTNGVVRVTQGLQTGLQPLQIRFIPIWSSSFSAKKRRKEKEKKKERRVGQPSSLHSPRENLSIKVQGVLNECLACNLTGHLIEGQHDRQERRQEAYSQQRGGGPSGFSYVYTKYMPLCGQSGFSKLR